MDHKTHAVAAGPVTPVSDEKHRANVFAIAAQAGVAVFQLADGSYLAARWGLAKPCPDLHAVLALVRQLKGAAHG
ncbi:MAG: hypothetical protein ACOVOD_05235 [Rhodoferax sp.]